MRHVPVLLKETIEFLNLKPGQNVLDCTLGDAGHSEAILEKTAPNGKLLGIDADPESVLRAKQYLYRFGERVTFARDNFANLKKIITEKNFGPINAVLMDLGWSSPQFAERGRGFSFNPPAGGDEPLDMRFGGSQNSEVRIQTAAEILNNYSKEDLRKIFRIYAEEKLSGEIAGAIVTERKHKPIERTQELVEIVLRVYRKKLQTDKEIFQVDGIHPATKVFQALRIAVNKELDVLKEVLPQAVDVLAPGGRLAVITFHSLEDRIVKQYFKGIEGKLVRLITKKPIVAGEDELKVNPRARSAKLRVVEKL